MNKLIPAINLQPGSLVRERVCGDDPVENHRGLPGRMMIFLAPAAGSGILPDRGAPVTCIMVASGKTINRRYGS